MDTMMTVHQIHHQNHLLNNHPSQAPLHRYIAVPNPIYLSSNVICAKYTWQKFCSFCVNWNFYLTWKLDGLDDFSSYIFPMYKYNVVEYRNENIFVVVPRAHTWRLLSLLVLITTSPCPLHHLVPKDILDEQGLK